MALRSETWRMFIDDAIEDIAKHNQYVSSDMVVMRIEQDGRKKDFNYSVIGPAMQAAARKGIIEKQPTTRKSKR